MASAFRRDDPVLYFRPRAHAKPKQRQYILWPVWVYRVVVPEVRERELNVLQKAVLGMCRAGVTHPEKIGSRMYVHAELATVILLELHGKGLLEADGLPTSRGVEVLEEETLHNYNVVTGHVFQDPWSGKVWPRFIDRLDYVEREYGPGGFPELVFGTSGRPRRQSALMVFPDGTTVPVAPTAPEILRANRRHRKALQAGTWGDAWEDEESPTIGEGTTYLDRVSLIEARPFAAFLTTYLYLPEDSGVNPEWNVCDPFGFGSSVPMRRAIEQQMDQLPNLRQAVERLIGKSLDDGLDKHVAWMRDLRNQASLSVEDTLTFGARQLPYYDRLVEMEYGRQESDLLRDSCPPQRLRETLVAARQVLEEAFACIANTDGQQDAWRAVYAAGRPNADREYVRTVYAQAAAAVGFATPLPEGFSGVKPGQVRAACLGEAWRLRALVLGVVLAAAEVKKHPMRDAARADPQLLVAVETVARNGGDAAHAGGPTPTAATVAETIHAVYRVVGLVTGLVAAPLGAVGRN